LENVSYERLLDGEKAQMAFIDASYNQSMNAISGKGRTQDGEFAIASGEMSREEFTKFLTTAFGRTARYSVNGAIHYQCIDWQHMREMLDGGGTAYGIFKNFVIWNEGKGGKGILPLTA
tara:strand:- start:44312 stop:44668 length:357 start_codon:yes stop_codon:yes gene_type:complete